MEIKQNDSKDLAYNFEFQMKKKIDELPLSEKDNSEYQSAEILEEEESQQNTNLSGLNDNSTKTKTQGYFSIKNFSKIFTRPCLISRFKSQEEELQKIKEQKEKILILNTIKHPKTVNGIKNAVRDKFSQSEIDKYFQSNNNQSSLQQQVLKTIKDLKVSQLKGWIDNSESEVIYPPDHYQQKKAKRTKLQDQKKNLNQTNAQQEQRQRFNQNQDDSYEQEELYQNQNTRNTKERRGLNNQINVSDFGSYIDTQITNINISHPKQDLIQAEDEEIIQQFKNQSGQQKSQQKQQSNISIESEEECQPPEKFNYNESLNEKQAKPRNQKIGKNITKHKEVHGKQAREKGRMKKDIHGISNKMIKQTTNKKQKLSASINQNQQQRKNNEEPGIQTPAKKKQEAKQQKQQQSFSSPLIFPSERQMRLSEKQNK